MHRRCIQLGCRGAGATAFLLLWQIMKCNNDRVLCREDFSPMRSLAGAPGASFGKKRSFMRRCACETSHAEAVAMLWTRAGWLNLQSITCRDDNQLTPLQSFDKLRWASESSGPHGRADVAEVCCYSCCVHDIIEDELSNEGVAFEEQA